MEKTTSLAKSPQRAYAFGIDLLAIVFVQITLGTLTIFLYKSICRKYGINVSEDAIELLGWFCGSFNFIAYFSVTAGVFGNTLGKYMMRIQTVDDKARPIGLKLALARTITYLAAAAMSSWYIIGFILPWFRKDKKALHDLLCGTQVVQLTPIAESNAEQLELPFLATVHSIRTPTKQEDPAWARTGTDL
jgi:uncharacterized RDD family membrane protein YckC